ncbi:lipopolysaccharide biosynthesis protein [Granulosicoccus sp. 3-233]|uniref:lipopolysaccharide biosynthesis protein n=1 Tax=Granulosicoccus sp. 3-233 TaxID=3417969 RepID=UPI003D32ACF4
MAAVGMFQHLRNYASAGVFSAVVGLISFPVLTRNLSVAEYGIVGLITSSLTLCIAVGKLGVQHAVIRFFAQIKNGNIDFTVGQMNSTVSMIFFSFASSATLLWLVCGFFVLPAVLQYENIPSLFLLASFIVFIRLLGSGVMNFLRAQQRSADVAISQSIARFLNLTLILLVLFAADLNPWTVIACLMVAESLGVFYAAWQYRPDFQFRLKDVSLKLGKAMLIYGLPLMMLESLGLVLRLSDRYLIEALLGVSALGQYSASYNLTSYIDIIILAALMQAVKPAYMQMWESQGKEPTQQFLSDGFRMYMVVGIPFIAMFSITSPYLLGFLAGDKYSPGTVIIPYVAISFWLEGAMHFLAAGLYIFKNTKLLMLWSLVATVTNLALNVLLIPRFGITGAAIVTIISYVIFMAGVTGSAFRYVTFPVRLKAPAIMLLASVVIFALLSVIDLHSDLANFLCKGAFGTAVLLLLMWFVDAGVRQWSSDKLLARTRWV